MMVGKARAEVALRKFLRLVFMEGGWEWLDGGLRYEGGEVYRDKSREGGLWRRGRGTGSRKRGGEV
jgi:hypothetical protein